MVIFCYVEEIIVLGKKKIDKSIYFLWLLDCVTHNVMSMQRMHIFCKTYCFLVCFAKSKSDSLLWWHWDPFLNNLLFFFEFAALSIQNLAGKVSLWRVQLVMMWHAISALLDLSANFVIFSLLTLPPHTQDVAYLPRMLLSSLKGSCQLTKYQMCCCFSRH